MSEKPVEISPQTTLEAIEGGAYVMNALVWLVFGLSSLVVILGGVLAWLLLRHKSPH